MKTGCGRNSDHSMRSSQKMVFHEGNSDFLKVTTLGYHPPCQERVLMRKNMKASRRIYLPSEWKTGLIWGPVWKKKIAWTQRERPESRKFLAFPQNPQPPRKGDNTIPFKNILSEKQDQSSSSCWEPSIEGNGACLPDSDKCVSGYLNVTPSVQLSWHSQRKI